MIKVTHTVSIDGANKEDYENIKHHLEELKTVFPGWTLVPEPLVNRMTAVKTEEVKNLQ